MVDQLRQVLLTYTTRRYFWLLAGIATLFAFPLLMVRLIDGESSGEYGPMTPMAVGYAIYVLAFFMVGQGKRHFAHPRARLMPGFTVPHVTPIVLLAFTAVALLPCLISLGDTTLLPGMLAFCACLTATLVWALHRNDMAIMLLAGLVYFSPFAALAKIEFWGLSGGASPSPLALLLMVVSWVAVAAYPLRLTKLHEEQSDYGGQIDVIQFDTTARGERTRRRLIGDQSKKWMLGTWQLVDWWHDRIAHLHQSGGAARIAAVSRYGFGPTPIWANVLVMAIVMCPLAVVGSRVGFMGQQNGFGNLPMLFVMPGLMLLIIPAAAGYIQLLQRWPRMEAELLRPQTRRQYIDGLHWAVFRSALLADLILLTWLLVICVLVMQVPLTVVDILVGLLLVVAIQLFLLPLGVLFSVLYRNMLGYMGYTTLAMLLFISLGVWLDKRDAWGHAPFVAFAAGLLLSAPFLLRAARQKWLQAEFG